MDMVSLTELAKQYSGESPGYVIQSWMRSRNTLEFFCQWENDMNAEFDDTTCKRMSKIELAFQTTRNKNWPAGITHKRKQLNHKKIPLKKGSAVSVPDVEWVAINGKEFYQLITSPAGMGRYFIDMDEFMIESTEAEYKDWRREKDHSDYLREQEEQAMASIVRKALNEALSSLDKESYMLIDSLILGYDRRSERDLAVEFGLSQKAINKRKQKILKNLKLLVLKLEKVPNRKVRGKTKDAPCVP